ncbi:hypothetical protein ACHAXT_005172 [Thalassiosira profunda]
MIIALLDKKEAIAWANFATLLAASFIFTVYYVKSVKPAALESRIGPRAYKLCERYRIVSGFFMTVAGVNYVVFYYFPLPGLPESLRAFPWPYTTSALLAAAFTPFAYLMWIGMRDAGEETMSPRKEHELYSGGIYEHMRHPQAVGEFPMWFTVALLCNSPALTLFTLGYLPIWYLFSIEEEKDLVVRYGKAYEDYCQRVGWFPRLNRGGKKAKSI